MEEISEARLVRLVDSEEFKKYVDELPLEQQAELAQKAMNHNPGGIVIIGGGNNMISNSNVIQLNGSAEDISNQLKNLSPEVVAELIKAVALDMKQKNNRE